MVLHKQAYTATMELVESKDSVLLLRARGHINTRSAALFEVTAFRTIGDSRLDVVIEASQITYLSTAGLRVFIRLWRELKESNRSLVICSLKPYINQVFELLGFHRVIDIRSDVESALAVAGSD